MLFNRALLYTTVLLATTVFAAPTPARRDVVAFSPLQVRLRSVFASTLIDLSYRPAAATRAATMAAKVATTARVAPAPTPAAALALTL